MDKDLSIKEICYKLNVSRNWIHQHLKDVECREATLFEKKFDYAGQKKLYIRQSLMEKLYDMTDFYVTVDYIDMLQYSSNKELTRNLYEEMNSFTDKIDVKKRVEQVEKLNATLSPEYLDIKSKTAAALYKDTERKPAIKIHNKEIKKFLFDELIKKVFLDNEARLMTIKDWQIDLKVNNDEMVYRKIYGKEYVTIKIAGRTFFDRCPKYFEQRKSACELPVIRYPEKI